MNLANKLTMLRIFLVPLFLIFISITDFAYSTFIATGIFIIASITDQLDGHIARKTNQITNFGKFADPLADKILVLAAMLILVEFDKLPAWAAVIIIAREFAVSGLRTIAAAEGKVIAASMWGKVKTVIQIIAIILSLIKVNISTSAYLTDLVVSNNLIKVIFDYAPTYSVILAVIITILSGVDYFAKNKNIVDTNK